MKNFNDIYEEIYKKSYKIIEEKRKGAKTRMILIFVLIVGIGTVLSSIVPKNGWLVIFLSILIALIYSTNSSKDTNYNRAYKQLIINNLIEGYNTNLEYIPNKGLSSNIYAIGEFERFDKYYSEDYISGTLNNNNILMAEVKTERRERNKNGNTYYVPIFQGLFAKVDFKNNINSTTKIRRNSFKLVDSQNGLEMDSGEFEKIFDVYSEGKIETMQILTLDTMQHIIDFVNETKLIPEFTIKENNIYIRFQKNILKQQINDADVNIFEANILKNPLDYAILKKYYVILNFIDNITNEISKNIEESGIQ